MVSCAKKKKKTSFFSPTDIYSFHDFSCLKQSLTPLIFDFAFYRRKYLNRRDKLKILLILRGQKNVIFIHYYRLNSYVIFGARSQVPTRMNRRRRSHQPLLYFGCVANKRVAQRGHNDLNPSSTVLLSVHLTARMERHELPSINTREALTAGRK